MACLISATPLVLGARASVRASAKVQQKAASVKAARAVAPRAELSTGEKAAAVAAVSVALTPSAARASELGEDLFTIFDSIDKAADNVESAFGTVAGAAGKVGEVLSAGGSLAKPFVERAATAAAPIGQGILSYAERTVVPVAENALKVGSSAAGSALNSAGEAIKAQGVDIEPVSSLAKSAANIAVEGASAAAPALTSFADFLTTASPTDLLEVGLAAGAAYLLLPVLLGGVGSVLRGYAGSISPVGAYDEVLSGGNIVVVDVRRESELSRGDIEFPRRAAGRVLSVPREKLSGNFGNMNDMEANLTALKVAGLKGLKKGTKVLMLDNNGGDAPKMAKALAQQGFGKVFVIEGGFNAWTGAGLGVKSSSKVSATVMPSFGGGGGGGKRSISNKGSSNNSRIIDVEPSRGFLGLPQGRD